MSDTPTDDTVTTASADELSTDASTPQAPVQESAAAPSPSQDDTTATPVAGEPHPLSETATPPSEDHTDKPPAATEAEADAEKSATPAAPEPAAPATAAAPEPETPATAPAPEPESAAPGPEPTEPKPSVPTPGSIPTPAAVRPTPHPPAADSPAAAVPDPVHAPASNAASFGRVAEDGTVFVTTPDGEREVGSYPGSTPQEALSYFARKYDELASTATLLLQRVTQTDLSTHDGQESLKALRAQIGDAHVVGDLAQLDATVEQIATALKAKSQVEGEARAAAKKAALEKREAVVAEAETIAAQPVEKVQWKQSTTRMRQLLDEWKALQRSEARLDKERENTLWHRFSTARNGFDKTRRSHFARLDEQHADAKREKERLVTEAERLAASKDWGPTASAFKRLMGEWRQAGRAARSDDDALWQRFKAAQDSFFHAKDEVVAAENVEFEANLKVKEELLTQAQALLPVKDLPATKASLRTIQDRWDAAGKVPRKDMDRIERAMRKVEQTVRDAEDARWKKTDPEHAARAQSMVDQLEAAVQGLKDDLAKAETTGDARKIKTAQDALAARQAWLDQARGGLAEFGG
ncbi:DUF349 domain-containing protein [Luteipulveratus sp. YIM 133132]|uniref:DUF349 domain-containing protein n=1 Tax=Luteipulveratus flavus TaxID=3031728 RepID=UPI0023AFA266|nr:DUF349 domain-containing protein [Luteipulveratus sp. YIM 133132]MDE9367334.1 DUF349 domain-containing protein [Luteipulveratus sp. YIM 133132]